MVSPLGTYGPLAALAAGLGILVAFSIAALTNNASAVSTLSPYALAAMVGIFGQSGVVTGVSQAVGAAASLREAAATSAAALVASAATQAAFKIQQDTVAAQALADQAAAAAKIQQDAAAIAAAHLVASAATAAADAVMGPVAAAKPAARP